MGIAFLEVVPRELKPEDFAMLDQAIATKAPYGSIALSEKVRRVTANAGNDRVSARAATVEEMHRVLAEARKTLSLASDEAIEAVMAVNPNIIQLLEFQDRPDKIAFVAQIPLNEEGAVALVNQEFDGADPDPRHVARPEELPAAIYVWLIYTPGVLGKSLSAISARLDHLAPEGCALFTKAVTDHTSRLFPAMGFISATSVYPNAAEDLLVVLPERGAAQWSVPKAPTVPQRASVIRVARTMEDLARVFSIRAATYIAEQHCPYEEEFDGNDLCATQMLGEIDGEPVGCLRIRFFADFAKIERLAVRHEYRTSKLAFQIVRFAIEHCREKGYSRIYGHARKDLLRFWKLFGLHEMPGRAPFRFSDVEYREVMLDTTPSDAAITLGCDPMITIRPEGAWRDPGPLDRSLIREWRNLRTNQK